MTDVDFLVDTSEHAGHREAVDGVPERDVLGDIVRVGDRRHVKGAM